MNAREVVRPHTKPVFKKIHFFFLFSKGGFLFPFCGSETLLLHLACGYWIPPSTVRFLSPPPLSYICVEWKEIKAGRKREGNAVIIGGRPLFFMFKIFFSHKNILTARLKTSRLCVCVCVCLLSLYLWVFVCLLCLDASGGVHNFLRK